jgi:D-glycero-D-manno-heptose 1,7-bisphosphate phosphatase
MIKIEQESIKSKRCCLMVFDRDGTLIQDDGYVHRVEDLRFLPGVREALELASLHSGSIVIATNQGGIGLGKYGEAQFRLFSLALLAQLKAWGIEIDCILACPHHPSSPKLEMRSCTCRKPGTAMLEEAISSTKTQLNRVAVFGDKQTDVEMARKVGVAGYLISGNLNSYVANWIDSHASQSEVLPKSGLE